MADRPAESRPTTRAVAARPAAEAAIAALWQPTHRAALLDAGLRRLDRKGRPAANARYETNDRRVDAFYGLRYALSVALASGAISPAAAREQIVASGHAGDLLVAGSREEAVDCLAELLAAGNNAWSDGDHATLVLWVTAWRD